MVSFETLPGRAHEWGRNLNRRHKRRVLRGMGGVGVAMNANPLQEQSRSGGNSSDKVEKATQGLTHTLSSRHWYSAKSGKLTAFAASKNFPSISTIVLTSQAEWSANLVDTCSPFQLSCPCIAFMVGMATAYPVIGATGSCSVAESGAKRSCPEAAVASTTCKAQILKTTLTTFVPLPQCKWCSKLFLRTIEMWKQCCDVVTLKASSDKRCQVHAACLHDAKSPSWLQNCSLSTDREIFPPHDTHKEGAKG